jgi:hypothetical protein
MATPEQQRKVDMPKLKESLAGADFQIMLDARILLLIRKGTESTVYSTGKVLLKTTEKDVAERAYNEIRPHLEAAWA